MKYLLIIGDGMADYPCPELDGRTPLEAADTPNMDELAGRGRCGRFLTLPPGLPRGSAVANLSILGYDPASCFEGRGVLEAASMGIKVLEDDLVLRCNLICAENGRIKNHSAGNISDEEARIIIKDVINRFGSDKVLFYPGVSYRHLLILRGPEFKKALKAAPPHDELGTPLSDIMIQPLEDGAKTTADLLNGLILDSNEFLEAHPVNKKRAARGLDMANYLWPWSPGKKPEMQKFKEKFGKTGAVISAVDLIKGAGVYAGFDTVNVKGATGIHTTNYEGKADAGIEQLKTHDFVLVHVEASDEAGHEGDLDLKIRTIEYLDKRLIGRMLKQIDTVGDHVCIGLLPDHYTPVEKRTHTPEPVPFVIMNPHAEGDAVTVFSEKGVDNGVLGMLKGEEFMRTFFQTS